MIRSAKFPCRFHELGIIEGNKSLQGGIGRHAAGGANLAGGCVEIDHVRRCGGAAPKRIKGATVETVAFVGIVNGEEVVDGIPHGAIGLIGFYGWTSDGFYEETGKGECGITELLCCKTSCGPAGEKDVGRITFAKFGISFGILAVGGGKHHLFDGDLVIPFVVDEVAGEPI